MNPVIHESQQLLNPADLAALPRQRHEADWTGAELRFRAEFVLGLDPEALHLKAWCGLEPDCDFEREPGEFVPGLWRRDVAELFILDPESGVYREWNLSPVGAWWTDRYVAERERDPAYTHDPAAVQTLGEANAGKPGWSAQISIERADIGDLTGKRMNVPMIARQHFLSCCPEPKPEPDFHNISHYPLPEIRPIE